MTTTTLTVNTPFDENDGTTSGAGLSLRDAIITANNDTDNDYIIELQDGGYYFLTVAENLSISSDANITIRTVGNTPATIEAVTLNGYSVFDVYSSSSTLTLEKVVVTGGKTSGIYNTGTLTIANSTISGNSGYGGGIYNSYGTLTVTNSTISNNSTNSGGGGILNEGGTLTIANSTISGNSSSDYGGGIYNIDGTITIANSTISGNSSSGYGGGIYNNSSKVSTLINVTVTNNLAGADTSGGGYGGGIYNSSGTMVLKNNIIAGNFDTPDNAGSGNIFPDLTGPFLGRFNNLIGNATGATVVGTGTDIVLAEGETAGLGPLQNNGGLTQTHALLPDSPAINGGNSLFISQDIGDADGDGNTAEPAPYDQRGAGFVRISGSSVDIGAFEAQSANVVLPTINLSGNQTVDENEGVVTYTVTLSKAGNQAVTVNYATANGTAKAGSDYESTTGTLSFAAGVTSKDITVPILDDNADEANEKFKLTLSNPSNGKLGTAKTATTTIVDDDSVTPTPTPTITLSSSQSINENEGSVTYTVNLSNASNQTVTVKYATANGKAKAGSDYESTTGTLTFSPGETSQDITVPIVDDSKKESKEKFKLTLSNPTNGNLGAAKTATTTILDDDSNSTPPVIEKPTIFVSANLSSVNEDNNSILPYTFIRVGGDVTKKLTVEYIIDGTATPNEDFNPLDGTITFSPGVNQVPINIPYFNDETPEGNETIAITLKDTGDYILGTTGSVIETIIDDDLTGSNIPDNKDVAITQSITNNPQIKPLLSEARWLKPEITYSFNNNSVKSFSNAVKNNFRNIFEDIQSLVNVNFTEVKNGNGDIRLSYSDETTIEYASTNPIGEGEGGDILLDADFPGDFAGGMGTESYSILLHEIAHAMGLKHVEDDGETPPDYLAPDKQNTTTTQMIPDYMGAPTATLMPYDIQTLQYLYGPQSVNNGDTTYKFSQVFQYKIGTQTYGSATPLKITIQDSGGTDTLDFTALAKDSIGYLFDISDLALSYGIITRKQTYNSTAYIPPSQIDTYYTTAYGTSLAIGTTIENVIGSASDDEIIGNNNTNELKGGAGDDYLYGSYGIDNLTGGTGDDIFAFHRPGEGMDIITDFKSGEDTIYLGGELLNASPEYDKSKGILSVNYQGGIYPLAKLAPNTVLDIKKDIQKISNNNGDLSSGNVANSDDVWQGDSTNDFRNGEKGNDLLDGGDGNDSLIGGDDNDSLYGNKGNDTLQGGYGDDSLDGATDWDGKIKDTASNKNNLYGGVGNDILYGGDGSDTLYGGNEDDILYGRLGSDSLDGGYGNDYLDGDTQSSSNNGSHDTLYGGAGDDYLNGGAGNDRLYGGGGSNKLYGGDGNDLLAPEPNTNVLVYNNGYSDNFLDGGDGNDTLIGGINNDILWGNKGADILTGNTGKDTFIISNIDSTKDSITDYNKTEDNVEIQIGKKDNPAKLKVSKSGKDLLIKYKNKTLAVVEDTKPTELTKNDLSIFKPDSRGTILKEATDEKDTKLVGIDDNKYKLIGHNGDDTLIGANGNDTLIGNYGDNSNKDDSRGDNVLDGLEGNDNLIGGKGADLLFGYQGTDTLTGGDGRDILVGEADNDSLQGGAGDDILYGGEGADTLSGGADKDTFWLSIFDGGIDTIADYKYGTDEKIQVWAESKEDMDKFTLGSISGGKQLKYNGDVIANIQGNFQGFSGEMEDLVELQDEGLWSLGRGRRHG